MDVRTAFLHGILKERIYIYALWYECIDAALLSIGLKRSTLDSNLYYLHQGGEILILLL